MRPIAVSVAIAAAAVLAIVGIPMLRWRAPPAPPPGTSITILVMDAHNGYVHDARVELLRDGEPVTDGPTRTGSPGAFRVNREVLEGPGTRSLRASFGPLRATVPIPAPVPRVLTVNLPVSFALDGRVVSRASGRAVRGAEVRHADAAVFSGEDGSFRLAVVPERQALDGAVHLRVRTPDGREQSVRMHWQTAAEEGVRVDVE